MEKRQLCYIIIDNDIKPAEFIENYNLWKIHVKNLEDEEEQWINPCYVCITKKEAYTKLLTWLESDKQKVEEDIKDLKEELNRINEVIRNLKQKYEQ